MKTTKIQNVTFDNGKRNKMEYFKKVGSNKAEKISKDSFFELYDLSWNPENNIVMLPNLYKILK